VLVVVGVRIAGALIDSGAQPGVAQNPFFLVLVGRVREWVPPGPDAFLGRLVINESWYCTKISTGSRRTRTRTCRRLPKKP
jgi:hypothetical protein